MIPKGEYKIIDWTSSQVCLDGGIGWIPQEEIKQLQLFKTFDEGLGTIKLKQDIKPNFILEDSTQQEEVPNNTTNTFGQSEISFLKGSVLPYQSIQYNTKNEKFYTVLQEGVNCFIPASAIEEDNSFIQEYIDDYDFTDKPMYPYSIALTLSNPKYNNGDGYVCRCNANYYDKGMVLQVKVDNNPKLNRFLYVIDNDLQGEEQIAVLFSSKLDKDYWGKRIIETTVVEKDFNYNDFLIKYAGKNEEVINFE